MGPTSRTVPFAGFIMSKLTTSDGCSDPVGLDGGVAYSRFVFGPADFERQSGPQRSLGPMYSHSAIIFGVICKARSLRPCHRWHARHDGPAPPSQLQPSASCR